MTKGLWRGFVLYLLNPSSELKLCFLPGLFWNWERIVAGAAVDTLQHLPAQSPSCGITFYGDVPLPVQLLEWHISSPSSRRPFQLAFADCVSCQVESNPSLLSFSYTAGKFLKENAVRAGWNNFPSLHDSVSIAIAVLRAPVAELMWYQVKAAGLPCLAQSWDKPGMRVGVRLPSYQLCPACNSALPSSGSVG